MTSPTVLVKEGRVTRIQLNRPDKHNAIDTATGNLLIDAVLSAGHRGDVGCIVISGAGASFCSGDDRGEHDAYHLMDIEPQTVYERLPYARFMTAIRHVPKPVIAQVHGHCLAAGLDLAMACDYVIAAADAKFSMLFGKLGIVGGAVMLPRHMGLKQATRLLFEGETLTAAQALELGMITMVAQPDDLPGVVADLAERLASAALGRFGYFAVMKELLNRSYFPNMEDECRYFTMAMKVRDGYAAAGQPLAT